MIPPRAFPAWRAFGCALAALAMLWGCAASGTAITGARVYPSPDAEPIDNAVILIRDGRIVRLGRAGQVRPPPGYEIIDRTGAFVVAGFWNSHTHPVTADLVGHPALSDAEIEARLGAPFLRWGFTTIVDLASETAIATDLRARVEASALDVPRLLTAGSPFYPEGGTPLYARPIYEALGLASDEVATPADAAEKVARQAGAGADAVKLFTGSITGGPDSVVLMDPAIVRSAVLQARAERLPVFAHPTNAEGLSIAIDNGVTILAHTAPLAGEWPDSFAAELAARDVALVPTLSLFEAYPDPSTPTRLAQQQLGALVRAGGDVLFGTDAGFVPDTDPVQEYQLMAAVMGWRDILAALTTNPAQRFGESRRRGRVAEGFQADLVILRNDPALAPENFASVSDVFLGGRPLGAAPAPAGDTGSPPRTGSQSVP